MTATEIVRAEAVSGLSEIPGDLEPLLTSWGRHLRAANMSPRTVQSYVEAGRRLDAFLIERGMPRLVTKVSREHVEAFIEELLGGTRPLPHRTATGACSSSSSGSWRKAR